MKSADFGATVDASPFLKEVMHSDPSASRRPRDVMIEVELSFRTADDEWTNDLDEPALVQRVYIGRPLVLLTYHGQDVVEAGDTFRVDVTCS